MSQENVATSLHCRNQDFLGYAANKPLPHVPSCTCCVNSKQAALTAIPSRATQMLFQLTSNPASSSSISRALQGWGWWLAGT